MTWTCSICKRTRPDHAISVQLVPFIMDGQNYGTQNLRYCNDNLECRRKAADWKGWFPEDEAKEKGKRA